MTQSEQTQAAKQFAEYWQDKGDEKQETQRFWIELLQTVLGVENPAQYIEFEKRVELKHTSFIDAYIPETKVLIEQKGSKIDLHKSYEQSDGSVLTPFEQAKRYADEMPLSQKPAWIIVCNFKEFLIYNMETPHAEPVQIFLKDFEKDAYLLNFLVLPKTDALQRELELSIEAGKIVGELYDELLKQYKKKDDFELKSLNMLCVRLVFCLYAEDSGIFGKRLMFHDFLASFNAENVREALQNLFKVLDQKPEERDPYMSEKYAQFPYVNGGLFKDEKILIPPFNDRIRDFLLNKASSFDWSEISPTIFGAVFESTLNPETRRSGGMHYTSIENIHKVIDPLFMDELWEEFEEITGISVVERVETTRTGKTPVVSMNSTTALTKKQKERLLLFQKKLGSLTFLDPACGSGNFLTETYLSLRRLENRVISLLNSGEKVLGFDEFIQVKISQFYGIEINDFAVTVAKTALWIAESQMISETEQIVSQTIDFLPLTTNAFIVEGNALRMDWATLQEETPKQVRGDGHAELVSASQLDLFAGFYTHVDGTAHHYDYIMGNPPFVGARLMNTEQKDALLDVFGAKWKNAGNLDFVSAWYMKAARLSASDLIKGTQTKCALVSTNSVCQGESVATLWKPLFADGLQFDFAWRTFRWDSESTEKAHVHCVIIGFSHNPRQDSEQPRHSERACHSERSEESRDKKDVSHTLNMTGKRDSSDIRPQNDTKTSLPQHEKRIYNPDGSFTAARHINAYLLDGDDIFVESRQHPLCDVPEIGIGNKPIDGGNYLFTEEEMRGFIKKEPESQKYFRKWIGSDEFINRYFRYCLYLGDCSPAQIKRMPEAYRRVQAVREFRLASKSAPTRRLADTPTRFHVENFPKGNYILIPRVSSEKRRYVPIGFVTNDTLCSDSVHVLDCSQIGTESEKLYLFGVLTSNVHMAWMRAVAGRLETRYRYSKDIVYNNFPFVTPEAVIEPVEMTANKGPNKGLKPLVEPLVAPLDSAHFHCTQEQAHKIERTAQAILDARAKYPDSSLAELYDETLMPPDLRKAHQANDRAVMAAYGFGAKLAESEIVSELFKLYEELTGQQTR